MLLTTTVGAETSSTMWAGASILEMRSSQPERGSSRVLRRSRIYAHTDRCGSRLGLRHDLRLTGDRRPRFEAQRDVDWLSGRRRRLNLQRQLGSARSCVRSYCFHGAVDRDMGIWKIVVDETTPIAFLSAASATFIAVIAGSQLIESATGRSVPLLRLLRLEQSPRWPKWWIAVWVTLFSGIVVPIQFLMVSAVTGPDRAPMTRLVGAIELVGLAIWIIWVGRFMAAARR